ncbi:P-loop containing nucleoside triphosphate hydrolase protein [Gloeopeniophorella convolvens]|nr:P-loop containing nucleoside triphosphate hydrolase protein [Gloeopeniophorella convolvens]
MTTRQKAAATVTRASTRATRATSQLEPSLPAPTRGTRATAAKSTRAPPAQPAEKKVTVAAKKTVSRTPTVVTVSPDTDREPIKAFLRIRPEVAAGDGSKRAPYLESLSDKAVRMQDLSRDDPHSQSGIPRFRLSTAPTSSIYTFTHVFPPDTQQPEFFSKTTLPLVRGLLDGENGLLFAYGVTNSGKTYTMQGGSHESSAGILPRTLDVLFNSIEGLQGNSKYRPSRLNGIELNDASIFSRAPSLDNFTLPMQEPVLGEVLAEHLDTSTVIDTDNDSTTLKVDRNYEYSVWLSYAEVYNEKIYDLLNDVEDVGAGASRSQPILLTRKALAMKPSPPSDNLDGDGPAGKYISGLTQARVGSAKEAKKLVKLGQLHRRVFGTLANSQSSRSHGIVTLKLLRKHRGEKDEPSSYMTSRLTLIDLAGSERSKNTQATGDRLKEAGNINKSLMVLGQCIEVMRANQKRVAQSLGGSQTQRSDTRDVKKSLALVPFRHSKLTEVLMDYFTGEGHVTMIININPYDTGFDENSNVMKFAALARDVSTAAPTQRAPPTGQRTLAKAGSSQLTKPNEPHLRKVVLSTNGRSGRKFSEAQLQVVEEDEDVDEEADSEEEPLNGLVDALFDEIEGLRLQLFEAEMRSAVVEAETRQEVMREMEERIQEIEKRFARRLMNEVELNERRMDAKIDMLHRSGMIGKSPSKARHPQRDRDDRDDEIEEVPESEEEVSSDDHKPSRFASLRSDAVSPLAGRSKTQTKQIRVPAAAGPSHSQSPSDDNEATETDSQDSLPPDIGDDDDDETDEEAAPVDSDDWIPASDRPSTTLSHMASASLPHLNQAPYPIFEKDVKAGRTQARPSSKKMSVSELTRDMEDLGLKKEKTPPRRSIRGTQRPAKVPAIDEDDDEEAIIVPNAKSGDGQKKKKKQLGSKQVFTDARIEQATEQLAKSDSGKNIRRMARGSK